MAPTYIAKVIFLRLYNLLVFDIHHIRGENTTIDNRIPIDEYPKALAANTELKPYRIGNCNGE